MRSWRNRTASCTPGSAMSSPSLSAGASASSTTSAGSAVAVCSRLSSARPPRQAIASTIRRDAAGKASPRAASSPATSDWPRCVRTTASSHRQPAVVAVSKPSRRSALSNSTVSYGFPLVCGLIASARPAAAAESACSISATIAAEAGQGQVVQPKLPHAGLVPPARQRMRRVHIVFAVGAHEQQAVDRLFAGHEVDKAERRAPRPLQVVEEHHQWTLARRDRPQNLRGRSPRPHLGGQWVARFGRHRQQRREFRRHRAQQTRVRADRRQDPLPDRGQARRPARPATVGPARETPDSPRRTRDPAGTGRTCRPRTSHAARSPPTAAHRPAPSCRPPARPRTSTPRHRPASASANASVERRHLLLAAYQPRRRQQPQGNITLADSQRSRPSPVGVPQPLQVIDHAVGGLVAVVRLLLQQMHDDRRQRSGYVPVHLRGRHRHPGQMIVREPQRVTGPERRLSRRQLV